MKKQNANYIDAEWKAKKVLDDNCLLEPPIIAKDLAEKYGLEVRFVRFEQKYRNVAGFIQSKDGLATIYINAEDAPVRQNFTIAHELGHYLLGHVGKPGYEVLLRTPINKEDKTAMEQEADCFAANLLVPENMLKDYLRKYRFISNIELSKLFGVSEDVIGFRKKHLDIGSRLHA